MNLKTKLKLFFFNGLFLKHCNFFSGDILQSK